jgi:deoxyribonuclease V
MVDYFRQPPDLASELRALIRQVPVGRVATCGALAQALGNVVASRSIGKFLREHDHDDDCNCHRIVLAGGDLGGYATGELREKALRLSREGVAVVDGKVDLNLYAHTDFQSWRPLEVLADQQRALLARLRVEDQVDPSPEFVAGVDVSYAGDDGVAAYALVDLSSGKLKWSTTVRRRVTFPYITSYLAYRELPILLELLDVVRQENRLADVVLVDGSGIMHPRGAGIASQLGIVSGLPTIGVTKKRLFGRVKLDDMRPGEMREVLDGERQIGVAIRHRPKSPRPLFVSPGHGVSVNTAAGLVKRLLLGRSLPETIYWADRLSRRET